MTASIYASVGDGRILVNVKSVRSNSQTRDLTGNPDSLGRLYQVQSTGYATSTSGVRQNNSSRQHV